MMMSGVCMEVLEGAERGTGVGASAGAGVGVGVEVEVSEGPRAQNTKFQIKGFLLA